MPPRRSATTPSRGLASGSGLVRNLIPADPMARTLPADQWPGAGRRPRRGQSRDPEPGEGAPGRGGVDDVAGGHPRARRRPRRPPGHVGGAAPLAGPAVMRSESVPCPWSRLTVPLPPAPPASGRRSVASLARVPGARPLAVGRHAGPLAPSRGTGLPSSSRRRDSRSRRGGTSHVLAPGSRSRRLRQWGSVWASAGMSRAPPPGCLAAHGRTPSDVRPTLPATGAGVSSESRGGGIRALAAAWARAVRMRASRPGISLSFAPSATAVFDPAKPCLPSSPPSTAACRTCSPITLWILYEEGAGYAPSPVRRMPLARRRGPRGRGLSTPSGPPRLQARDDQGFSDSLPRINSIMEASSMREIAKLFFPASLSDAPTR